MYAIQLLCLFDEIRIILKPLMIAIFLLCLLPKMRYRLNDTGYKAPNLKKKIARNLPHVVHAYNPAALGTILFFLSALHVIITSH